MDYSNHHSHSDRNIYNHSDRNISALNYLSYTEKQWKKYNNPYLFQNRLKHQDYKKKFIVSGYKIKKFFRGVYKAPDKNI